MRLLPLSVLALAGCHYTVVDSSDLCFGGSGNEADLQAEVPLTLHVFDEAGCNTDDFEVTCALTVEGDVIVATTTVEWVNNAPLATNCADFQLIGFGSCTTPPLPAGTWTLRYADDETTFEVPGTASGCLDGYTEGR